MRAHFAPKFGRRLAGSLCSNSEEGGVDVPSTPTPIGMSAAQISMLARAGFYAAQIADAPGMSQSPVPSRCTKVTRQTLSPRTSRAPMLPRGLFPSLQKPAAPESAKTFDANCRLGNRPALALYLGAPKASCKASRGQSTGSDITHLDSHYRVQSINPRERLQKHHESRA